MIFHFYVKRFAGHSYDCCRLDFLVNLREAGLETGVCHKVIAMPQHQRGTVAVVHRAADLSVGYCGDQEVACLEVNAVVEYTFGGFSVWLDNLHSSLLFFKGHGVS